jgi:diacylglycerol kinase (ATP)
MDVRQVIRTGVIINPMSGRGRGKGLALAEKLNGNSDVDVAVLGNFGELDMVLQRMASKGVKRLFISSGDGTVHAIQTWLAENLASVNLPQLCLLPHGTTNLTAADLGFRDKDISRQTDFIQSGMPTQVVARNTVRVANPKRGAPLHGMFFGTGAVPEATRYAQQAFNDKGVGGSWATFATLAKAASKTIFSKPDATDINRFDRPHNIELKIDGTTICHGPQLLMLATTLNKLILNSRPFWGGGTKPLRTTTIPYPLPSPLRWLLPALFGSETRTAPPGATSVSCQACTVTSDTEFVIDGEFYDAPQSEPLRVEAGPLFQYLIA